MPIMHQVSAIAPQYAYSNRYIHNISNLTVNASFTWIINWGNSYLTNANGMGICSYIPDLDNARPAFNGQNTFFGGWSSAYNGLNAPSRGWIGSNGYFPEYETGILTMDHAVPHNTSMVLTVGPDLGGFTYDISMRLIIAELSVDETVTRLGQPMTNGHGLFTINWLS